METKELDARAIEAFAGTRTPKFLATASADGIPNIVPVISIEAWKPDTLIFGEFMIWKTKKNLLENKKVGAAVFTANMNCWTVKGTFDRFERTGEIYDHLSMSEMFRYNAYTGFRNAGIINVEGVSRARGMIAPARLMELVAASSRSSSIKHEHTGPMPPQVTEKFSRLKAAKFISYIDRAGFPLALPAFTLFPINHGELEIGAGALRDENGDLPELPIRAAASLITFDPVAYQIKGMLSEYRNRLGIKTARFIVDEVYSASPPLPGKRIDGEAS